MRRGNEEALIPAEPPAWYHRCKKISGPRDFSLPSHRLSIREMRLGPTLHPTDANLVTRTLAGDVSAFEVLVRRYRGLAFGLAYHQLGRFEDAEDAAQEAMVEAYLKLRHLREPERFAGWLRRIVAGKAVEAARRRREEPIAPELLEAAQARDAGPSPCVLEAHVRDA